jgi:hypothetical protein
MLVRSRDGHADISRILECAVKACVASLNTKQQELTMESPSRPLRVSGDVDSLVRAFTAVLLSGSKNAPEGNEFILAVTASDFRLGVCISNAVDATPAARPSDDSIGSGARARGIAQEQPIVEADLACACQIIAAAGGTTEASDRVGVPGSRFFATLPLATRWRNSAAR